MSASRIAVCSWSLSPADPASLIERLRRLHIDRVQLDLGLMCAESSVWFPALGMLPAAGITVVSGMMKMEGEDYSTLESIAMTGGVRPDATWDVNRTRAEMVAEVAAELRLDLTTFHAGFIPEREEHPDRRKIADRLRTLAAIFGERGVRVGLETGQETAVTLRRLLEQLDEPNIGVNFDPANMILYGKGDPVAALEHLSPWVWQVHVKDALPADVAGTWGREVPAGEGAVDWDRLFAVAASLPSPVEFVIEREAGAQRDADVRRAAELVASQLAETAR